MRDQCECSDHGCKHNPRFGEYGAECEFQASVTLYRIDMADESGLRFCQVCADDAMTSGLFTDSGPSSDKTFWR